MIQLLRRFLRRPTVISRAHSELSASRRLLPDIKDARPLRNYTDEPFGGLAGSASIHPERADSVQSSEVGARKALSSKGRFATYALGCRHEPPEDPEPRRQGAPRITVSSLDFDDAQVGHNECITTEVNGSSPGLPVPRGTSGSRMRYPARNL